MKIYLRAFKNVMLKLSVKIACIMFILGGCLADSRSWVPMIMITISTMWLVIMAYANGGMYEAKKERA